MLYTETKNDSKVLQYIIFFKLKSIAVYNKDSKVLQYIIFFKLKSIAVYNKDSKVLQYTKTRRRKSIAARHSVIATRKYQGGHELVPPSAHLTRVPWGRPICCRAPRGDGSVTWDCRARGDD